MGNLSLSEAEYLLSEASISNPGPWVRHSFYVADAAARLAVHIPGLDPDHVRSLGLVHDIGRRFGITGMRHIIDGYAFLTQLGFAEAARIALTHSFPIKDIRFSIGVWDCSQEEFAFVETFLEQVTYRLEDQLLQLCDALALPEGFCLLEKRFVDVTLRYGVSEILPARWRATMKLQAEFETMLGASIYRFLPGVVETTFGFV